MATEGISFLSYVRMYYITRAVERLGGLTTETAEKKIPSYGWSPSVASLLERKQCFILHFTRRAKVYSLLDDKTNLSYPGSLNKIRHIEPVKPHQVPCVSLVILCVTV
jgi:hypothetical protein